MHACMYACVCRYVYMHYCITSIICIVPQKSLRNKITSRSFTESSPPAINLDLFAHQF